MSLQHAAKYLASKGRGEDSVLIHMTPGEVKSLQAVAMAHGGSLTVNPETGLPEAGFLSSILPMVVGAGITAATGGAAAPWMVGLGVGGLETLRTGNLGKGLMAGLGAYGGAGIGQGLIGAGTSAVQDTAMQEAMKTPQYGAADIVDDEFGAQALNRQGVLNQAAADATKRATVNPFAEGYTGSVTDALKTNLGTMGEGLSNPGAAMQSMGGGLGLAKYAGAAAAPMLMGGEQGAFPAPQGSGPNPYNYRYETGVSSPFPQANARGVEQNYFPNARYVPMQPNSTLPMAGGGISDALTPGQPVMYAAGGGSMYNLGDYSDGGRLLRGPGDGVSDSIPATIGNKRPARLADGEFVVPARIVSELGNGSTDAGARKLYAMMDRVQSARGQTVGKGRVAKNTRSDKYLPA